MLIPILVGPPFRTRIDDDPEKGQTVTIPLAQVTATDQIVSVDSHLAETVIDDEQFWEFSFEITVTSLDGGWESFSTQDRDTAANFIPVEIRHLVMDAVCASFRSLLQRVRPYKVYRVTKARNPDEKVLQKHHLLTQVLLDSGYSLVQQGTDAYGRAFWLFQRDGR